MAFKGQKDHKIGAQDVVAIKAEPKSERPPERYESGPSYGQAGRAPPSGSLSRSSLAAYNGGAGQRDYRTIMTPNERYIQLFIFMHIRPTWMQNFVRN